MNLPTTRLRWSWIPLFSLLWIAPAPDPAFGQPASESDGSQWVMPNGNYAGWNYSPLDQINVDNVENLAMAWTMQLGIQDSFEASPLVIGDTMYLVTPKPNHVYALDKAKISLDHVLLDPPPANILEYARNAQGNSVSRIAVSLEMLILRSHYFYF